MAYNSYTYLLVFLASTFILYYSLPIKIRWIVLFVSSYIFYIVTSQWLIIFLLITTLSVYLLALFLYKLNVSIRKISKELDKETRKAIKLKLTHAKKLIVIIAVIINFGLLFYLKYFNFFGENINMLLTSLNLDMEIPKSTLMLPLGISFYTLQAVSYIVDVYRGKHKADNNFCRLSLFFSFFGHIVEGPISRYDQLANQLYQGHKFVYKNIRFGLQLIVWGLFKKMVVADRINALVTTVFDQPTKYSGIYVIVATLMYTIQIYSEFSGCMDIVIGSSQLFGVSLAQNFARPFFSTSVNDFWRRWHITLGAWLRDYVFYPVSLSKAFMNFSKKVKCHFSEHLAKFIPASIALFCVWLGNGIWHGSDWKYIVYGLYYYVLMMIGMLCGPLFDKLNINRKSKAYRAFQIMRTFVLVNIGMLMFRAMDLVDVWVLLGSIFTGFNINVLTDKSLLNIGLDVYDYWVVLASVVLMLAVGVAQEKGVSIREFISERNIVIRWAVYFIAIFSVIIFGAYGKGYAVVDFIYAQF